MAFATKLAQMRCYGECTNLGLVTQIDNKKPHTIAVHKCVVAAAFCFIDDALGAGNFSKDNLDITDQFKQPKITEALVNYVYNPEVIQEELLSYLTLDSGPKALEIIANLRLSTPAVSDLLKKLDSSLATNALITPKNYLDYMRMAQRVSPELQMSASMLTNTAIANSSLPKPPTRELEPRYKNIAVIQRQDIEFYHSNNIILIDLETLQTFSLAIRPVIAKCRGKLYHYKWVEVLTLGIEDGYEQTILAVAYNHEVFEDEILLFKFHPNKCVSQPVPPLDFGNGDRSYDVPYMYTGTGYDGCLTYFSLVLEFGDKTDKVVCQCSRLLNETNAWHHVYKNFSTDSKVFQRVQGAKIPAVFCRFIVNYSPLTTFVVAVTSTCLIVCTVESDMLDNVQMEFTYTQFEFEMTKEMANDLRYTTYNNGDVLFTTNNKFFVFRATANCIQSMTCKLPTSDFLSCGVNSNNALYYVCNEQLCNNGPHLIEQTIMENPQNEEIKVSCSPRSLLHLGHEQIWNTNDKSIKFQIMSCPVSFIEQLEDTCLVERNSNPEFGNVILANLKICEGLHTV